MKGDFSRWDIDEIKKENFNGVLHQQGRVLLDNDWNAAARITNAWQDQNGRDVIGPGVAAVPAEVPDSFKVLGASVETSANTKQVVLEINPGRVWADGLLTYMPGEEPTPTEPVKRVATYLEPPIQDADISLTNIGDFRDAVILEVWREAVNGFQMKDKLIEPALGGPDTTERVHTAMAFRLLRLREGENCENIRDRLRDDPAKMGTLKVSLQPPQTISGECPVEQGGGYTGFEHHFYRIEIAQVDREEKMFKWSRFNGGLVGRGKFKSGKVNITDNFQAITTSGLTSFYLEAVEYNESLGHWQVTYGAEVTLNSDNQLDLDSTFFGSVPAADEPVFFRLWDGIKPISEFLTAAEPEELENGIRLEFDDTNTGKYYRPGDYWTFEVRAGEISNKETLIGKKKNDGTIIGVPPEGIIYHRVPLAILNWEKGRRIIFIHDCRVIFQPLTKLKGCCTVTVGPGGDFDKIQKAVDYLDNTSGGLICILPGVYRENVIIEGKRDIIIRGCDKKTIIIPGKERLDNPIFHIKNSQGITLEHMRIVTFNGIAVSLEGEEGAGVKEIEICNNTMIAFKNAIHVNNSTKVKIRENKIRMIDKEGGGAAIFIMAEDSLVRGNDIGVVPAREIIPPDEPDDDGGIFLFDPCLDWEEIFGRLTVLFYYVNLIFEAKIFIFHQQVFKTVGGIQIAGGCDGVKILENRVNGGSGNGITLGSTPEKETLPEESENAEYLEGTIITDMKDFSLEIHIEEWIDGGTIPVKKIEAKTDDNCQCKFSFSDLPPGTYKLYGLDTSTNSFVWFEIVDQLKVDPNFIVEIIKYDEQNFFYIFSIKPLEGEGENNDIDETLAFIYDVLVEDNEILNMGLSGIGSAWFIQPTAFRAALAAVRTRRSLSNPVENLTIRQNHIFNCLQNPYNIYEAEVQQIGLGGISLGMCENLSIFGNRIENNGTSHIYPVCGIFIYHGEFVDISHNIIVNNGPLINQGNPEMKTGIRAGIFMNVSASSGRISGEYVFSPGKPAARIHDNVVDQPAGNVLVINAAGPLSIQDNQFNSESSGTIERVNIKIANSGGISSLNNEHFVPDGNILFCNNQTRVGPKNDSNYSHFIETKDDIGFHNNQSYNFNNSGTLLYNTFISAQTIRASGNYFMESKKNKKVFSLYTCAEKLNNTVNNQGTNKIHADSALGIVEDPGNQVIP